MGTSFQSLDSYPDAVTATGVLARLVDGIGFRFYWATDGLAEGEFSFRPHPATRSIVELLEHMENLVARVSASIGAESAAAATSQDGAARREQILRRLEGIRERLARMAEKDLAASTIRGRDGDLPFWNLINGPLSDLLTHIGQINSWRTISGVPGPRANLLRGLPPAEQASG